MTEYEIFECDGCGDRHGHKTEMQEILLIAESGHFDEPETLTTHLCTTCTTKEIDSALEKVEAFGVDRFRGEVKAAILNGGDLVGVPQMYGNKTFRDVREAVEQVEQRLM